MRKPALCICENKALDQLSVTTHLISAFVFTSAQIAQSLYYINFKPLAVFCDCTARFVSDLVGNPVYFGRLISINFFKDRKRICVYTKILENWRV